MSNFIKKYHDLLQDADRNRAVLGDLMTVEKWVKTKSRGRFRVTLEGAERDMWARLGTFEVDSEKAGAELRHLVEKLLMLARADFYKISEFFDALDPDGGEA